MPVIRARRIWILGSILIVLAMAVTALIWRLEATNLPLDWIPLPVIALGFLLAETKVINLEFRREAQSYSLNEVPMMVGFFALAPGPYVIASVAGTVLGLSLVRGQRGVKLLVNAGHVWLGAAVAIGVFRGLAPVVESKPSVWLAALVASLAGVIVNSTCISIAVALVEGTDVGKFFKAIFEGMIQAATTASIGLTAVVLLILQPFTIWLLLVPLFFVYLSLHAYGSEKRKHDRLEMLYESTRILQTEPDLEDALHHLLAKARASFRAGRAEILLYPENDDEPMLRSSVTESAADNEVLIPVDMDSTETAFRQIVEAGETFTIRSVSAAEGTLREYIAIRGFREVLVAPLRGETRIIGAFILADRFIKTTHFQDEDIRLFTTLANQASVSLENGRLEKSLAQLRQLKDELRYQAYHDALTGLANRMFFNEEVEAAVAQSRRKNDVAVIFVDLDDFKTINDTLGHEAGDTVLKEVANRLNAHCRQGDVAARLGGDEFALVLRHLRNPNEAVEVGQRILEAAKLPVQLPDRALPMRFSLGIAMLEEGHTSGELIRNADVAMYHAKNNGKECLALYAPQMHEEVAHRLTLREELRTAINTGQLRPYYQPLVDLETGCVRGLEALVRWQHPDRGLLTPDQFLGVAAGSDLIMELDQFMLHAACTHAQQLIARGFDIAMNVNLAARQINSPTLSATVLSTLDETGLDPHRLVLEITEKELVDDGAQTRKSLQGLRAVGVRIAIDDFGTGYSSLAYLRSFPVDILKVPKPFVDDITHDEHHTLARAVIDMSRALGLRTVAEGIETIAQRDLLSAWGCDIGQGFIFYRPMTPEDTVRVLQAQDADTGSTGRQGRGAADLFARGGHLRAVPTSGRPTLRAVNDS